MALARRSVLKSPSFLNNSSIENDDDFDLLLENATSFAEDYTSRTLERESDTPDILEYRNGRNKRELYLDEYPVDSITLVEIWDGSEWETIDAAHYELRKLRTLIYPLKTKRADAVYPFWPRTNDGIRITYSAGYLTTDWMSLTVVASFGVPRDLEQAVCMIARKAWYDGKGSGQTRAGLTSVSRGDESVGFGTDRFEKGMPPEAQAILDIYTDHHV